MPEPHMPTPDQSSGIRVVKIVQGGTVHNKVHNQWRGSV
jgi:hypothetical protein